jgi:hypothetical protein
MITKGAALLPRDHAEVHTGWLSFPVIMQKWRDHAELHAGRVRFGALTGNPYSPLQAADGLTEHGSLTL